MPNMWKETIMPEEKLTIKEMKHFKIVGPLTTREFDIDDNEMLTWSIIKVEDFEKDPERFLGETLKVYNEKIYDTK